MKDYYQKTFDTVQDKKRFTIGIKSVLKKVGVYFVYSVFAVRIQFTSTNVSLVRRFAKT